MPYWSGYSTTPASNNAAAPNGFPENMPAGSLNDSARQAAAAIREVGDIATAALPEADLIALLDQPNGIPILGADGKIPSSELPAIAFTDVSVVISEATQLALPDQEAGDVAIRTDINVSYIHNGGTAGTMADWTQLATPTDAVLSVAGRTGAVVLVAADINNASANGQSLITAADYAAMKVLLALSNVDNTSDANKPVSTATQTALDLKSDIDKVRGITDYADNNTLVLTDAGKLVRSTKATAMSITVPANASVAFPIGTYISLWQNGAGQLTITAGGGVTIRSKSGHLKLVGQYSAAAIIKVATNEWDLSGDLSA